MGKPSKPCGGYSINYKKLSSREMRVVKVGAIALLVLLAACKTNISTEIKLRCKVVMQLCSVGLRNRNVGEVSL